MKFKLLLVGLGVIAGLAFAAPWFARPYTFHGSLIDPAIPAADFALTDQDGQPFPLSALSGKVVLLFFGYTNCADACPTTLTQFKQIRAQMGQDAGQVHFVLVTVDPERDTPDRLRAYLSGFDPSFVGLTGPAVEMESVWKSYGVYREKLPVAGAAGSGGGHTHGDDAYVVDHTTRIYAIDRRGNLRLTYTLDAATEDIAQDVQQLLKGN